MRFALLDTETTGLSAKTESLVELAFVVVELDELTHEIREVARFASLHDPGKPIPRAAQDVHGISNAMVRGQRIDTHKVRNLLDGVHGLVAHNASFDRPFMEALMPELAERRWWCTLRGLDWSAMPSRKLEVLARALRIRAGTAHRAMGDVETLLELVRTLGPSGTPRLAELVQQKPCWPKSVRAKKTIAAKPTSALTAKEPGAQCTLF